MHTPGRSQPPALASGAAGPLAVRLDTVSARHHDAGDTGSSVDRTIAPDTAPRAGSRLTSIRLQLKHLAIYHG